MKKIKDQALWMGKIILGCALFAVSFDLFLEPNDLNAGGVLKAVTDCVGRSDGRLAMPLP